MLLRRLMPMAIWLATVSDWFFWARKAAVLLNGTLLITRYMPDSLLLKDSLVSSHVVSLHPPRCSTLHKRTPHSVHPCCDRWRTRADTGPAHPRASLTKILSE